MAGALLTAAGLEVLITSTRQDYEDKAVALAHDSATLARMRQHLVRERTQGRLFDTPRFVRNLEAAFLDLAASLPLQAS
jgi:predicted O-linked N-acetylglucosamine transferase (SPINDLY family)